MLSELGEDMRAKVRTTEFTSKLHLVDLAGSERVKRSGVTGACLCGCVCVCVRACVCVCVYVCVCMSDPLHLHAPVAASRRGADAGAPEQGIYKQH